MQIDSLYDLPKEKRPPDLMIWDGKVEDLDKWIHDVFSVKKVKDREAKIIIKESEIEG